MKQWYYAHQGERKGPVDAGTLQNLYRQGHIRPDDLVWQEGMPDWCKASSVQLLQTTGSSDPQTVSPTTSPAPILPPVPVKPQESTLAIVALVSGIISLPGLFICCGFIGLVPVITGHLALSEIRKNPSLAGKGIAKAGLIMGYITLGISLLFFLVYAAIIIFALVTEGKST